MRTVCGLLTVLMILGPIGMGMLFNVDAPLLGDDSLTGDVNQAFPENHGTRSSPSPSSIFLNLYFHSSGSSMNTSDLAHIPASSGGGRIVFTLQDPLIRDFIVEKPSGDFPMMANVHLSGTGSLTVEVRDNSDSGPLLGSATHTFINAQAGVAVPIYIPLEAGWGESYTFSATHQVVIVFDFGLTVGLLHYDSIGRMSYLRLYCTPIEDIEIKTYNFYDEPVDLFYPNNIDFPDERKKVKVKGVVSDVLGKSDKKYIRFVQVQIQGPGNTNFTEDASWDKDTSKYSYTWQYLAGQAHGEYNVTAHVFDEQNHEFTVITTFNMSKYGALLTSPSQVGGEGSYAPDLAKAKRNVVPTNVTRYHINVWNIGNVATGVNLITSGPDEWDWWFEGENLTIEGGKTGEIASFDPGNDWGDEKGIILAVNSKDNPLNSKATIFVTASPTGYSYIEDILTTVTTVVLKYDVELKFTDNTDSKEETVDIGGEVDYDFTVTNNGGTADRIWIDVTNPPSGWTKSLSGGDDLRSESGDYYVDLDSGKSSKIMTLSLNAPNTAGDETANVDIIGTSQGSQDQGNPISSRITATTHKTMGLSFNVTGESSQDGYPGDILIYSFELTNTGATSADFTVSFEPLSSSDGWSVNDISLDQENLQLGPGNNEMISLYVEPTIEVMAGDYDITVRADRGTTPSTSYEEVTVYCTVNEYYNIEVIDPPDLELYGETEPGKDVEFEIRIKNSGNTQEKVNILVDLLKGWELDFGNANDTWSKELDPQDIETVTIVLTPPDDAEGDETVDITISVVPVESDQIDIETHTKIKSLWFQPLIILLVPILLLIVIVVMVIVIYKRR